MLERIVISELNPITNVEGSSNLLIDQNGYKRVSYSDFVVDVRDTLQSNFAQWDAGYIDGDSVISEQPQNGEVFAWNTTNNRYENTFLESGNIDWSGVEVNEYKFLHVNSSGNVEHKFVEVPSLRIDNDYSSSFFLRVKSGSRQIEAVAFNPDEFTINAQTLEGNSVSDLDGRYLRASQNLFELYNLSSARNNLGVISETESDDRYISKASNLSDVNNTTTAFDNIKQQSTPSYAGVIEIGTSPEVQDGIRDDVAVVPSTLKGNYYNKSESNDAFLRQSNNLSDLDNPVVARTTLDVYSRGESDSRYLIRGQNLDDLTSKPVARDNLDVYSKEETYTRAEVRALLDPPGKIIMYAGNDEPNGYLFCDGSAINRFTYSDLFDVIGTTYGGGNGSTTFNLPDLEDEFIRGASSARPVGSVESESIKSHNHTGNTSTSGAHSHSTLIYVGDQDDGGWGSRLTVARNTRGSRTYGSSSAGNHSHSFVTSSTGGSETRPRNVSMRFCIKY